MKAATAAHNRTAATDPQVPGPGLPNPAPKNVATAHAQRVFRGGAPEAGAELLALDAVSDFGLAPLLILRAFVAATGEPAKIFEDFGIEHGRTDFVNAHGPLAEINFSAAVAAEGEILILGLNNHAAGGTVEEFCGFFLRASHLSTDYYPAIRRVFARPPGTHQDVALFEMKRELVELMEKRSPIG
jgi:hypothetical protein